MNVGNKVILWPVESKNVNFDKSHYLKLL